jgi:hypothetical protein
MRSEMMRFVVKELMTRHWMRALLLRDAAAAQSDRPDHGPMGAYDAWPALMVDGLIRLGYRAEALDVLHRFEAVTHEGPFSQSHELLGRSYDAPVRVAGRGQQATNELCGSAFAEVIVRSFFGFRPDWGESALANAEIARQFEAKLTGLRWRGKLYTVAADAHGVSLKAQ